MARGGAGAVRISSTKSSKLQAALERAVSVFRALDFAPDLSVDNPITRALKSGRTERVVDADEAWRDSVARSPEHRTIIGKLAPRSLLIVPLVAHGRTIGLLEIISTTRRFDARDQETGEELGRLCALALVARPRSCGRRDRCATSSWPCSRTISATP